MLERETIAVGTMSAQIERSLGMRVVAGDFAPGDTLPVEAELCDIYGVSRTTVREAIKRLASKQLIEVSPKIGTRVRPFAEWNLLDRDVLAWRLHAQFDSKIVEDIFEVRLCFEPRACFLAARDGSAEDHRLIARHLADLETAYAEAQAPQVASDAAVEFHLAIIRASQNGLFATIGGAIKSALRVSAEMERRQGLRASDDVALHRRVSTCIASRRAAPAARAMEDLLAAARTHLLPLTVGPALVAVRR